MFGFMERDGHISEIERRLKEKADKQLEARVTKALSSVACVWDVFYQEDIKPLNVVTTREVAAKIKKAQVVKAKEQGLYEFLGASVSDLMETLKTTVVYYLSDKARQREINLFLKAVQTEQNRSLSNGESYGE